MQELVNMVLGQCREDIREMSKHFPVIVGEWCLSHNPAGMDEMSGWQKYLSYRTMADTQLSVWDEGAGFFFWSYKLISQPEGWDFRRAVENGWLPDHFGK